MLTAIAEEIAGGTKIFRQHDRRHAFAVSSNYQFAPTVASLSQLAVPYW